MPATVDCVCLDRLRRAEIALPPPHCGAHPIRHAPVKVEDNSPVSNDDEVRRVAALAMKRGKGLDFSGYEGSCFSTSDSIAAFM